MTITDDPPTGVSVLFFQVSLTAASLQPASSTASPVSLLNNNTPIQIDVTQLQALSAFLSTANVAAGSYNSLSLTFANPELVIFNASDTAIASTCAVGSVCELTPTIDNSATVSFSTSPFPVTLSATSPLGLLIDFHLNTVIQSDLSVNLGVTNGVTISELPTAIPTRPQFGALRGAVVTVSASQNQFTAQTAWGRTYTIDTSSTTAFDGFPTSACSTPSIACLAAGQIVQVQISGIESGGILEAAQVTYLQAPGQQTATGTIVGLSTSASGTIMKLILHDNPSNSSGLILGGEASVSIAGTATFSVAANGFTIPAGLTFTGPSSLLVGQNVMVDVMSGSLAAANEMAFPGGWGPPQSLSFTADTVALEPSQVTGIISALDASADSFTLGSNVGPFFAPWPWFNAKNAVSYDVLTTTQTTFQGFSTEDFGALATGNLVSVRGWLFAPASSGGTPSLAANTVVLRSNGFF